MATQEEINLAKFNDVHHTLTGGEAGKKSAGHVYNNVTASARDAAWLRDALTPGQSGKRSAGFLVAMLSRIEFNTAQSNATIQALVGALKAVTAGESFDEAKLLASIDQTVRTAMADTVKVEVTVEGNK